MSTGENLKLTHYRMAGIGSVLMVLAYLKQRPLPAAVAQPAAKPGD